jgi:endonuclease-3 related protein
VPPSRRPRVLARTSPLRRRLVRLYDALHDRFGTQSWWRGHTAFEIVAGVILTQGTTRIDAGRPPASPRGARLRRPAADRLRALVRHVARHHQGSLRRFLRQPVSAVRTALLSIPGISEATADAILLYAAGRPVFVADAPIRRSLARHRIVAPAASYATVRALLGESLPRDPGLFNEYHALLVRVAKEYCRTPPDCARCPLRFDLRGRSPRL